MRLIDADKLIDDYNKSDGTISDLMELILDAAEEAMPPNPPLTLGQLREMDGKPILLGTGGDVLTYHSEEIFSFADRRKVFRAKDYGKTWLAYRRKPEEGTV